MTAFEKIVNWFMFDIFISLLPLLISFGLVYYILKVKQTWPWYHILKEGELFLFANTLVATSLGKALMAGVKVPWYLVGMLIAEVIVTVVFLALSYFVKYTNYKLPDEKIISQVSITLAFIASGLSLILSLVQ